LQATGLRKDIYEPFFEVLLTVHLSIILVTDCSPLPTCASDGRLQSVIMPDAV